MGLNGAKPSGMSMCTHIHTHTHTQAFKCNLYAFNAHEECKELTASQQGSELLWLQRFDSTT